MPSLVPETDPVCRDRPMSATDRFNSPVRRQALALVSILLGAVACLAQAPAGKVTVADVIPQGNRLVASAKILSLIKTRPGSEYSQALIDEDVRRLYETRLFGNIQVSTKQTEDHRIIVYFHVAEYPSVVQDVLYQGAKHLKPDELESITGIRKGAPLNPIA